MASAALEKEIDDLEEEKAKLEDKLQSEEYMDESEIKEMEDRIGEILGDIEIKKAGLIGEETVEQALRRSERERHPTEKMLAFQQDQIAKGQRKFLTTYCNFKGEIQHIRSQLKEPCSKTQLEDMISNIEKAEADVNKQYESLRGMTTPSQEIRRKTDCCTAASSDVTTILNRRLSEAGVKEFDAIAEKDILRQLLKRDDTRSVYGSTMSKSKQSSQRSQTSEKKTDIAAQIASKRAAMKRDQEIAEEKMREDKVKMELHAQQERIRILEAQRDIEAMEAEYNVYVEEESKWEAEIESKGEIMSQSKLPETQKITPPATAPQTTSPPPLAAIKQETGKTEVSLAQVFKETLATTRLPAPEPFIFKGDPLKFIEWRNCFKALIETTCTDSARRLYYLKKYIEGEALNVLDGMFYRSDEEAYAQAWEALNDRYGHSFVVQRAFRGKLSQWPKIGSKESLKLREFSDFLVSCKNAMPHVPGLKVLDDCEENQKLLQKLPDWATSRWNRHVTKELKAGKPYPDFKTFSDFMVEEASIACNPISSLHALKGGDESSGKDKKRLKVNALATTAKVSQKSKRTDSQDKDSNASDRDKSSRDKRQLECAFCKEKHFIYKCDKFAALTIEEKKKAIVDNKLCYACLRIGHVAKECRKKATCNVCKRSHPTPLHEERAPKESTETQPPEETASNHSVRVDNSDRTSMIVPVWLSCKAKDNPEILVYALLDTQSSNTFIDQDICEKLKAETEPVKLRLSTMTDRGSIVNCERATGLSVRGYRSKQTIELPPAYTRQCIPLDQKSIPTRETAKGWTHLHSVADKLPSLLDCPVGLLIGYDCAKALRPTEVIAGKDSDPYAVKTELGWSVVGSKIAQPSAKEVTGFCHRVSVKELPPITPTSVIKALETDFLDTNCREKNISQEDIQFLQQLNGNIHHNEKGHLEMPLPFRVRPQLPNNKHLAVVRARHLKRKLDKNAKYREDYVKFMEGVFKDGDAEEAVDSPKEGNIWYIPHHGVYHPRKPEKIRVVFDCSAKFEGTALNDHLLTGPDLTNTLTGVLCRFREHPIAITCDVEKMFHRFHVHPDDRDFMRFLWWENGNTEGELKEYRMRVHIFGAASSPGCANYGMKHLACEYEKDYPMAASFIRKNFYVDDGLISLDSVDEAVQLIKEAQEVCAKEKIHLHKFVSNRREVLDTIPESERATAVNDVDLNYSELPMQSVLGVKWNVETDAFSYNVVLSEKTATRRGILSTVASVYDPLGFLSPYILTGKKVLQEMCKQGVGWDDPIPPELQPRWEAWIRDLENLPRIQIPRCFIPENLGTIQKIELHHFSDASNNGYGQCSYIRVVAEEQVHCALVMGKARVAPINVVTIPRLELTAATVSAAVSNLLREELDLQINQEFFWTDSQVVLGYIKNEARRFHVFVANRVQRIRDTTDPNQWFYIETSQNPADHASRGLKVADLCESNWLTGPKFLWEREIEPNQKSPELLVGDPEIRVLKTDTVEHENFLERLSRFSDWNTALNTIARIQRLASRGQSGPITVQEREKAATTLVKVAQTEAFEEEQKWLSQKTDKLPKTNKLYQLDPTFEDGLLRVGGRLERSTASLELKHPIILPREGIITQLILDDCHKKTQHQGRGQTLNQLRASGYWIIGASKMVAKHIKNCVTCRKVRGRIEEQRMADLPVDRVDPSPPFSYTGIDVFGPFHTKTGRKENKRYGLLFTCLSSRAIHIEMLEDLTTDAFLNALRCFIAIRGAVTQIRCDRGTNFVGARNELQKCLQELDEDRIATYLGRKQCDFLMNVPEASHMGGVWERQIRTVRSVMNSVLMQAKGRLDDASLRTFFYEAMSIVNNRPLTTDTINDPKSVEPLTPNHFLTMKTSVPLPPPGNFVEEDIYGRKRWRRVQYLTEQFWSRWRKEYLSNISLRQRWLAPRRNVQVGDVVILKEDNVPRNDWKLARVLETSKDEDGLVRKVKLQIGQRNLGRKGERLTPPSLLERPVQKLVVLVESRE